MAAQSLRHDAVYIRINRKQEEISLAGTSQPIIFGGIMFEIERTPKSFCIELRELLKSYRVKLVGERLSVIDFAHKLRAELCRFEISDLLRTLIMLLPIYTELDKVVRAFNQVSLTREERAATSARINSGEIVSHDSGFNARMMLGETYGDNEDLWNSIRDIVYGKSAGEYIENNITAGQQKVLRNTAIEYIDGFIRLTHEIDKLRWHLPACFSSLPFGDDFERKYAWMISELPFGSREWCDNECCTFEDDKNFKVIHRCVGLTSLVAVEVHYTYEYARGIGECQLCNEKFVKYSSRARYCHRPNYSFGGKKCSKIGRQEIYRAKLNDNELMKLQKKNYKTYHQWMQRQKMRNIPSEVSDEVYNNFNKWLERSRRALEAYAANELSEDACRKQVMLPDAKERSARLLEYLKYERGCRGILETKSGSDG